MGHSGFPRADLRHLGSVGANEKKVGLMMKVWSAHMVSTTDGVTTILGLVVAVIAVVAVIVVALVFIGRIS